MSKDLLISIIKSLKVFFGDTPLRRAKIHHFLRQSGLIGSHKFQNLIDLAEKEGIVKKVKVDDNETHYKFI